jgi:hypothetical protein
VKPRTEGHALALSIIGASESQLGWPLNHNGVPDIADFHHPKSPAEFPPDLKPNHGISLVFVCNGGRVQLENIFSGVVYGARLDAYSLSRR